jgi:hypothetical protein
MMNSSDELSRVAVLKTVLMIDGSGVGLLAGIAAVQTLRQRFPSRNSQGLAASAAVGITGFGLAAAAVWLAARAPTDRDSFENRIRGARRLILAGSAVNTIGCVAAIATSSRSTVSVTGAAVLLVAGDILSGIYYRQLFMLQLQGRHDTIS